MQSSSELRVSCQTWLYHVENCHPWVDSNPRRGSLKSDALTTYIYILMVLKQNRIKWISDKRPVGLKNQIKDLKS